MPETFNADAAAGVDVVFQYNITGTGGGDWFCEVKDGACNIEAGQHAKPVCTLEMGAGDFLEKPVDIQELTAKISKAQDKRLSLLESKSIQEIEKIIHSKGW